MEIEDLTTDMDIDCKDDDLNAMDPELWGDLQYYIPLDLIFAKLPLREFFQLRLVCKDWDEQASNREFLLAANPAPISDPHFHLFRRGPNYEIHGLLTYISWKRQWEFICLGHHEELDYIVANQGVIYFPWPQRVFDLHSRIWYHIPGVPPEVQEINTEDHDFVVALKVDTSSYPYQFHVIQAGGRVPTHVYDSRTGKWTVGTCTRFLYTTSKATCAQAKDVVYLCAHQDEVYCYDFRHGCWDVRDVVEENVFEGWLTGVGAWRDRIYHLTEEEVTRDLVEITMCVWDDRHLEWTESDRMPPYLCDWFKDHSQYVEILASFWQDRVLIYTYDDRTGDVVKYVMYNLETRVWEIPDVPEGRVLPFLSDEETEEEDAFGGGYLRRKKARRRVMEACRCEPVVVEEPATLDDWTNFADQL